MHDTRILEIRDEDIYTRGQMPVRGTAAVFMVGDMGPFTVKIPKGDNWSIELRAKIDEEATRVRSLLV